MSGLYGNYQGSHKNEGHSAYLSAEDDEEAIWNSRHTEEDSMLHSFEGTECSPQQAYDRASAAYSSIFGDCTLHDAGQAGQLLQLEQKHRHPNSDTQSQSSFGELVPVSGYRYEHDPHHQIGFPAQAGLVQYAGGNDNQCTDVHQGRTMPSSLNRERPSGSSQNAFAQAPTWGILYCSRSRPEGYGGRWSQKNADCGTVPSQCPSARDSAFHNTQETDYFDACSSSSLELQPHCFEGSPLVEYTSLPITDGTPTARYEGPWSTENTRQREVPICSGMEWIAIEPQTELSDATESMTRSYPTDLIPSEDLAPSQTSFDLDIEELIKSCETVRPTHLYGGRSQSQPANLFGYFFAQAPMNVEARLQGPPEIEYRVSLQEGTPPPVSDNLSESNIDQSNLSISNTKYLSHSGSQGPSSEPHSPGSVTSSSATLVIRCDKDDCSSEFSGRHRKGNLARHKRLKHKDQGPVVYRCEDPECQSAFLRQDARLKHYRHHHTYLVRRLE